MRMERLVDEEVTEASTMAIGMPNDFSALVFFNLKRVIMKHVSTFCNAIAKGELGPNPL